MGFLRKVVRLYLILSVIATIAIVIFYFRSPTRRLESEEILSFLVDTPACRIPDLNPFDKSIIDLVEITQSLKCGTSSSITYEDGDMLRLNHGVIEKYYDGDITKCQYQAIKRGPKKRDSNFELANAIEFINDTQIMDEFIKVHCMKKSGRTVYTNFHTFVVFNNHSRYNVDFTKHWATNKPKEVLNVMMIGVDSLSRLNFMRQMPRTRRYLLDDMAAVEMQGYTKVADNTFVNIVPMTTGKFLEELPWNETLSKKPMDPYGYIWKNFSSSGYRTLYAEDAPDIAIFNFLKEGFHDQPTDHYNRAFSVAMEKEHSQWHNEHHCFGDRLETDIVLNYAHQFSTTYTDTPHFGFVFISRLTHDTINDAGRADDAYKAYLERMTKDGLLDNTILIFFSDHGVRFGKIRTTYVGKFEERMPFMFFVLPTWFRNKYPHMYENLRKNKNRLTTPFDIHETLLNVLFFTGKPRDINTDIRGVSLFNEISVNRSCENASILTHWCMCLQRAELPKNSDVVKHSIDLIINKINERLSPVKSKCAVLNLKELNTASQMTANNDVLRFRDSKNDVINRKVHYGKRVNAYRILQLTIVTSPGGGMFEATINFDENNNEYSLSGDISRINKYGNQSRCLDNFVLRKYCFCV